jgi:hypothetical protein
MGQPDVDQLVEQYAADGDVPRAKLERAIAAAAQAASQAAGHGATASETGAEAFIQGYRALRGTHRPLQ